MAQLVILEDALAAAFGKGFTPGAGALAYDTLFGGGSALFRPGGFNREQFADAYSTFRPVNQGNPGYSQNQPGPPPSERPNYEAHTQSSSRRQSLDGNSSQLTPPARIGYQPPAPKPDNKPPKKAGTPSRLRMQSNLENLVGSIEAILKLITNLDRTRQQRNEDPFEKLEQIKKAVRLMNGDLGGIVRILASGGPSFWQTEIQHVIRRVLNALENLRDQLRARGQSDIWNSTTRMSGGVNGNFEALQAFLMDLQTADTPSTPAEPFFHLGPQEDPRQGDPPPQQLRFEDQIPRYDAVKADPGEDDLFSDPEQKGPGFASTLRIVSQAMFAAGAGVIQEQFGNGLSESLLREAKTMAGVVATPAQAMTEMANLAPPTVQAEAAYALLEGPPAPRAHAVGRKLRNIADDVVEAGRAAVNEATRKRALKKQQRQRLLDEKNQEQGIEMEDYRGYVPPGPDGPAGEPLVEEIKQRANRFAAVVAAARSGYNRARGALNRPVLSRLVRGDATRQALYRTWYTRARYAGLAFLGASTFAGMLYGLLRKSGGGGGSGYQGPGIGTPGVTPNTPGSLPDIITQIYNIATEGKNEVDLPRPLPMKPEYSVVQQNSKKVREKAKRYRGASEFENDTYGPYNKKLPSLTLSKKAYANFRRSDPDRFRLMSDEAFDEGFRIGDRTNRDQGTFHVHEPVMEPAGQVDSKHDTSFLLYDAYNEIGSIALKHFNDATGFSKMVGIKDNVPGDLPKQLAQAGGNFVDLAQKAKAGFTALQGVLNNLK